MSCSCWKGQFDHFNVPEWTVRKQLKTGKFYPLPRGWCRPQRSQKVFKGTRVNFEDMKTRGFVSFCLNRKGLVIQNADPAQACLSEVNEDWKSKDDTRPLLPAELDTWYEAGSNAWWRATNLANITQWFAQQATVQLFSFWHTELVHHCISLGAIAVYGVFQLQHTMQEAEGDMESICMLFLWWIKGFAADISQRPQIEVNAPRSLIHTYWWHNFLLHCVFICHQWFCLGWIPAWTQYNSIIKYCTCLSFDMALCGLLSVPVEELRYTDSLCCVYPVLLLWKK